MIVYGLSTTLTTGKSIQIVAEVNGHANTRRGEAPPGTDSSAYFRAGARFVRGPVRVDAALVSGMTARDADIGFTAGFTWFFQGMEVP